MKSQGGQHKLQPLTEEVASRLAFAIHDLREFLGNNSWFLDGMPDWIYRLTAAFDRNLTLFCWLREEWSMKDEISGLNELLAFSLGWEDFSPGRNWLEHAFGEVAGLAFVASDEGFFDQVQRLKQVMIKARSTTQDEFKEAYLCLERILSQAPFDQEDDSASAEIHHLILSESTSKIPTTGEIQDYLWHYWGIVANRKTIQDAIANLGWELAETKRKPSPGRPRKPRD